MTTASTRLSRGVLKGGQGSSGVREDDNKARHASHTRTTDACKWRGCWLDVHDCQPPSLPPPEVPGEKLPFPPPIPPAVSVEKLPSSPPPAAPGEKLPPHAGRAYELQVSQLVLQGGVGERERVRKLISVVLLGGGGELGSVGGVGGVGEGGG